MYKASIRWMVKRAVARLSAGDDRMVLALLAAFDQILMARAATS